VAGLADGSLPVNSFKYYLVQDYLFLVSRIPDGQSPDLMLPGPICESECFGCLQGEDNGRYRCGEMTRSPD
jgi:hypothetical protein